MRARLAWGLALGGFLVSAASAAWAALNDVASAAASSAFLAGLTGGALLTVAAHLLRQEAEAPDADERWVLSTALNEWADDQEEAADLRDPGGGDDLDPEGAAELRRQAAIARHLARRLRHG